MKRKRSGFNQLGNDNGAILYNKLTVGEAKHMIRNEGGPMRPAGLALQIATLLAVSLISGRAILKGQATAWHLFLPMVAEYLTLLITLPFLNFALRDPELRKDTRRGLILIGILLLFLAGWITLLSIRTGQPWVATATERTRWLRDWIAASGMHWAVLAAVAGRLVNLPNRIAAFRRYGPPFVPIGLGCAMRMGLFAMGIFLLPWVVSSSGSVVWTLWGLILVAEATALWMHLDIQTQLKKRGIQL